MSKSWYNMTPAKADDGTAEILLYDVIGGWGISAKQFAADLKALKGASITMRINSPGGDVIEGAAIINILKADRRPVTSYIDGMAASMASVVAMVGKVVMPKNALMFIHEPWKMSVGTAEELRKDADLLDKLKNQTVETYLSKCGHKTNRDALIAMMAEETWMDGAEAVAAGFADECTEETKAAACAFDVSKFAFKADARVAALMPKSGGKPDDGSKTDDTEGAAKPDAPVLLDAAVVESRIESERAVAFAAGAASREKELAAIRAERDTVKGELSQAQANITQLAATVAAERKAREAAVKAHAALMGGVAYIPADESEGDFLELQRKYGHAEARRRFPGSYAAYMKQHAPGSKQGTK